MRINTPVELQSGRGKIEEILPAHVSKDAAVLNPTEKHDDTTMLVDFTHPELCAKTRPVSCLIDGRAVIPARGKWSRWFSLLRVAWVLEVIYTPTRRWGIYGYY